jgi:bifunctional ADP-heptose synthase (sugar kinase/adenylyltransferase)
MTDAEILHELPRLRALVVGDICLDRWCHYDPALSIPSVETGIRRVAVTGSVTTPGAGGTIANNLAALKVGRVSVLGVAGDDGHGFELRKALLKRGIRDDLLVEAAGRLTFTYTKLINHATGVEDLPRVDFIYQPDPQAEQEVLRRLPSAIGEHDLVLISDQAETDSGGVVTGAVRNLLADLAATYPGKVFLADSRRRVDLFRQVSLKPNWSEAGNWTTDLSQLRGHTKAPVIFVTRGGDAVHVVDARGETKVAARRVENPVDICGAGDSFAAGAAAALLLTGDAVRAAEFGNRIAGITINKPGTGTASPEEVLRHSGR